MLPDAVLLPFSARRLANPAVVLRNTSLCADNDEQILEKFAYAIPPSRFDQQKWGHDNATFYAERYGGQGILSHGGGVRCGNRGNWQIKGIGRNLLAGADVKLEDSNGCLHLPEALRELLWGELCHHALPFGSVRAAAVIATGNDIQYNTSTRYRTGLVVREVALRPAHFTRSLYFRPSVNIPPSTPSDSERVRSAIKHLPDFLPCPAGLSAHEWLRMSTFQKLHAGLTEVARRLAEQTAAAQARRIMHGAITPSNVALDGRWLDFGTMSALPGYENVKHMQRFWDDPDEYKKMFSDLCFYIEKYFPRDEKAELPKAEQLAAAFSIHYLSAARRRFLQLTGVPNVIAEKILPSIQTSTLCDLLFQIARSAHRVIHDGYPCEDDRLGDLNLGQILTMLATSHQHPRCDDRLKFLLQDAGLRRNLISSYNVFSATAYQLAADNGISAHAFRRLMIINANKAARVEPLFLRKNLVEYTEQLDQSSPDINELRERVHRLHTAVVERARVIYEEPEKFSTHVLLKHHLALRYDASSDRWLLVKDGKISELPSCALEAESVISRILSFSQDNLWKQSP